MFGRVLLKRQITSDQFDRRLGQVVCFGGAPVVLVSAVVAMEKFSTTANQFLTTLLAASGTSIALVMLGIVAGPRRTVA